MKSNLKLKRRIFLSIIILGFIGLAFGIAKRQLEYPAPSTKIYRKGDVVKIYGTKNCYIKVKDCKIVSKEDYLELSGDEDYFPEYNQKAVIIHSIFMNQGDIKESVEYNLFPISYLATKNMVSPMNMYKTINYNKETNKWESERIKGFDILPGEENEVYMVVTFLDINDPKEVWENFEKNDIFLTVSYYPVHQKIKVN